MLKREAAAERQSKGEFASPKLGKANRNHLSKKTLSSEFESVSKEPMDLSPISEVSNGIHCPDIAMKHLSSEFASVLRDSLDPSLVSDATNGFHNVKNSVVDPFSLVQLTATSQITTRLCEASNNMSSKHTHCGDTAYSKISSLEANAVVEHLKNAWNQIHRSDGIDDPSKKLVDTLMKTVIEQFNGIHEDYDLPSKSFQAKTHLVITCLLLWMICTLVAIFVKRQTDIPFNMHPPT